MPDTALETRPRPAPTFGGAGGAPAAAGEAHDEAGGSPALATGPGGSAAGAVLAHWAEPGPVQMQPSGAAGAAPRKLQNPLFAGDAKLQAVLDGKTTVKSGSGAHVRKVQQALVNLGYSLPIYGVDGGFGGETQTALTQFQTDAGVAQSGVLDAATMDALDQKAPQAAQQKDFDYAQLLGDGLLDFTVGVGYDEGGSFDSEIELIEGGLKDAGFDEKGAKDAEAVYKKAGMAMPQAGGGKYFIKAGALKYKDKNVDALVRIVTYQDPDAKKAFLEAMQNSDVALYTGHGRYGSGPDFDHKDSGEGNIWINPNPTVKDHGTGHMYEKLKKQKAEQPLPEMSFDKKYKVWFFDGCNTKHYLQPIRQRAKVDHRKTDTLGWGQEIAVNTTHTDVLIFIDGLIQQQSPQEIIERLNKANGITRADKGVVAEGLGDNPARKGR